MRLPNADRAQVAPEKLSGYCLNPAHPHGRHKARVFAASLGVTASDERELSEALLSAARDREAELRRSGAFGDIYIVDFVFVRGEKRAPIRSAWMIRRGEDFPRLITCYVRGGDNE